MKAKRKRTIYAMPFQKRWQIASSVVLLFLGGISCVMGQMIWGSLLLAFLAVYWGVLLGYSHCTGIKIMEARRIPPKAFLENLKIPVGLPLPYAIISKQKQVLFHNAAFAALFPEGNWENPFLKVTDLLPSYQSKQDKQSVTIGERSFTVYCQLCEVMEESKSCNAGVYALCFIETTEQRKLEQALWEQKPVTALIFLDNYEEVTDDLEDSKLPMLKALIDRKLNAMAVEAGGILKKFEKDRYLLIVSQKQLEVLKEKKFEIVSAIREISVGGHMPVTISMGIGIGEKNFDTAMKHAKAAVDLALGRGGDQVLIKEGEKYLFYGGKSGEVSHNARIRARVKADALWEMMGASHEIFVMGHKKADLDCIGACIGIYAIARAMGKPCHIVLDQVSVGMKRLYERLQKEEQYQTAFLTDQAAVERITEKSLVVVVDTHRNNMTACPKLLGETKKIVVFDHHRKSTDFIEKALLIYHEPYASSTCELITEMIQYFGEKVKIKPVEADALLAGITVDTKNFCVKTGAITFEAAAFLRRIGADSTRVRLLFQNDMAAYQAKATAVKDAKIIYENMAFSVCPSQVEDSILTAAMAADDLLNIIGISASFVCCLLGETVYISARSLGDINVQRIMEKLGGGGHMTVSGAQLQQCTLEEAEQKLKEAIESYLKEETT